MYLKCYEEWLEVFMAFFETLYSDVEKGVGESFILIVLSHGNDKSKWKLCFTVLLK